MNHIANGSLERAQAWPGNIAGGGRGRDDPRANSTRKRRAPRLPAKFRKTRLRPIDRRAVYAEFTPDASSDGRRLKPAVSAPWNLSLRSSERDRVANGG